MNMPALLAFFCGFASLSLEILWVRLYGFTMMSTPAAFGFVLMAYLAGIALGARAGGKACQQHTASDALWIRSMRALMLSAVLSIAMPFIFAWGHAQWWRNPLVDFVLIALVSSVLAYVFPIAHHLGAGPDSGKQGKRFAAVYTSNVLGAALGPLVTGYVLLNLLSLQQSFFLLAALQLLAVALFFALNRKWTFRVPALASSLLGVVVIALVSLAWEPHHLIHKVNIAEMPAKQVIENRHGIITLFAPDNLQEHAPDDDAVYGGNVYDGRTNLSLQQNTNGLDRPLLLAALQPKPKRVLMVGLSIGSWLALVNGFPGVEHIDVVEINSGYLQAAQAYPAQARALQDPRVNIVIDDARRWLKLHPEQRYDLVIMNTTWHWRANSSFLLSREYLQLIRQHMAPGAVMAFNATGSPDALYTATKTFKHAYRYSNFVYAAEFDFRPRKDAPMARRIYAALTIDSRSAFFENDPLIEQFLQRKFIDVELVQKITKRQLEEITDNNAITEFKYGRRLHSNY